MSERKKIIQFSTLLLNFFKPFFTVTSSILVEKFIMFPQNDIGDDDEEINGQGQNTNFSMPNSDFNIKSMTSADLFSNADSLGVPDFNKLQEAPIEPRRNPETSPELIPLFQFMSNFQPPDIDITAHFKPFLPELIPSIGAIDAFIKVPRPDAQLDNLGLTILDEPSISQTNSQILKMELREKFAMASPGNIGDSYIGELEKTDDKAITSFVDSIEDIHRNRPPPTMQYSTKMPELEDLMEVWPEELENALKSLPLPDADLDLTVDEYIKVICAILEIPIKGNTIESLHVLFSLFAQFEGNQYFQSQNPEK